MIKILNYQLVEKLYEGHSSLVYRARRETDKLSVVVKILRDIYPEPDEIARFKREYELTRNMNLPGVAKVYQLLKGPPWAIVLEDFGGESFKRLNVAGQMELTDFLDAAIKISGILGEIHQRDVIHKDLNPANIVLHPTSKQIKIIDFGISTILLQENPTFRNPKQLTGTLAYISPEQTGRMNRTVDYRTDFYSLGATFYELLTGELPFTSNDPLELVHYHIAKEPHPPHEVNPAIPKPLSDIVMKLLAKTAEERYQSAWGMQADLEACLRQLQQTGQIEEFSLAQYDISDKLNIPQKLYGRQQEIDGLLAAFERVVNGNSEMILVGGYAGIGKSALIQEIYQPILSRGGYFICGKFEQFERHVPYSALVRAFSDLVLQLLTESEAQIKRWREQLLAALGPNAQLIIDLIPEVELIIGTQSEVQKLEPRDAQNRFTLLFQSFIRVFCNPPLGRPLVLFLDDLQWANAATLKLIRQMMEAKIPNLLLIGTYRDNEVTATHPLIMIVDLLKKSKVSLHEITLNSLSTSHITELIAETLHYETHIVQPLAELVMRKTEGNPFFVNEFLKTLYQENLLTFETPQTGIRAGWQWDIAKIEGMQITDNVVELMIKKLKKLPDGTQQVLQLAACIGKSFDLYTLSVIYNKALADTFRQLLPATREGLLLATSELQATSLPGELDFFIRDFRFLHNRVRQAAIAMMSEQHKQAVHLQIGRLMLAESNPNQLEDDIFKIINHLNLGLELVISPQEQEELVRLNYLAGRKAMAAAAYLSAWNYLQVALRLLAPDKDCWQQRYDLTLALYIKAAEAAYLNGLFSQMEHLVQVVLASAKTLLDKVQLYEVKIQAHLAQNQLSLALEIGLDVLTLLGVSFPQEPTEADMRQAMQSTQSALAGQAIEDLLNLPAMSDPIKLAAMRLLNSVFAPAYLAAPQLMSLIVAEMVKLSVAYGNAPESAFAYANYGLILCSVASSINTGSRFGQLALNLLDHLKNQRSKVRTIVNVNFFIRPWQMHLTDTLQPLLEASQIGLESGDLPFAAYALHDYCLHSYFSNQNLATLAKDMSTYGDALARLKQERILHINKLYRQVIANLREENPEPYGLTGPLYDEEEMRPLHEQANDNTALAVLHFNKLTLCYLFGEYTSAVHHAALAEQYLDGLTGTVIVPIFHFYQSLAQLAIYPESMPVEKANIIQKIKANQEKMQKWAHHAPMNHLHKYYLVEAEYARVLGQDGQAREYYDQAIELAVKHSYTGEEALACELASKLYTAKGRTKLAQVYLHDAHYAYRRWGASAKAAILAKGLQTMEVGYNLSNFKKISDPFNFKESSIPRIVTRSDFLDTGSILKASQALSGEIVLAKLLEKMIRVLIENAGAQWGALILQRDGQWLIEAKGSIESDEVTVLQSLAIDRPVHTSTGKSHPYLPTTIINYVVRTGESLLLNDASNEASFSQAPYIKAVAPKSLFCMPLKNQGKLIGMLYLENNLMTGAFTPGRLEVLTLLSSQAAISIENARLYNTLEHKVLERTAELAARVGELTTFNRITQIVASVPDLQTILGIVAKEMTDLFDTRSTGIALLNNSHTELVIVVDHTTYEEYTTIVGHLIPLADYPASRQAVETGQPIVITQAQKNPKTKALHSILRQRGTHSLMIVPLRARGEVIGTIALATDDIEHLFKPQDVKLAETIAGQIAGAIENARLFTEEQRQRQIAQSLREVATILNSSLDRNTVLAKIMEQLGRVIHYDGAAIFLQDNDQLLLSDGVGYGKKYIGNRLLLESQNPIARIFKNGQSLIIADVYNDPYWEDWEEEYPIRSWMGAALLIDEQAIGVLTVDNVKVGAYSEADAQVLQIFANQAAIAIENAHLFEEKKIANEALAQTLQKLKVTQNQLIVQEKMASLGILTAGIAHEIKNPLNFVNSFAVLSIDLADELAETLNEEIDKLEVETRAEIDDILQDLKLNAANIHEEGLRADSIVHSMLMHSRGSTGQRQATDLNALVAEAVKLAYHAMRSKKIDFNIQIEANYDPTIKPLLVVPQDLNRVFVNLVNNAYYAMRKKKQSLPPAQKKSYQALLTVCTKNHPNTIEIQIRDNGPGIPQEIRDKLFNPFFSTKPTGEGTGLGLSISYDIIVQGHQGTIDVQTNVGEYAQFVIHLPKSGKS